jgi:uncharacterized membrane protein
VSLLGSLLLTMIAAPIVYALTGSMLLAGMTGVIGGIAYSRGLRGTR